MKSHSKLAAVPQTAVEAPAPTAAPATKLPADWSDEKLGDQIKVYEANLALLNERMRAVQAEANLTSMQGRQAESELNRLYIERARREEAKKAVAEQKA